VGREARQTHIHLYTSILDPMVVVSAVVSALVPFIVVLLEPMLGRQPLQAAGAEVVVAHLRRPQV